MNGILAVLFTLIGPTMMWTSYCETGCLAPSAADRGLSVHGSSVIYEGAQIGNELYLRYESGTRYGPFQPVIGASVTNDSDVWVGGGATIEARFGARDRIFAELSLMPGFHFQGSGPNLGGVLEARSGIAVGYAFDSGAKLALSFDHRSNADIYAVNPGMETLSLRYTIPLN